MTEFVLVIMGIIVAICGGLTGLAWRFAEASRAALDKTLSESARSLLNLREAATGMAEAHNTLVTVQAEQAQTLERIGSELAARNLRR